MATTPDPTVALMLTRPSGSGPHDLFEVSWSAPGDAPDPIYEWLVARGITPWRDTFESAQGPLVSTCHLLLPLDTKARKDTAVEFKLRWNKAA